MRAKSWNVIRCHPICLENFGLEYDRMRKKKQLDIATKGLREIIVKQNMRDFRKEQADKEARKNKEYGKVLFEVKASHTQRNAEFRKKCYKVGPRDRNDQIRRLEHSRTKENMERRRKNSQRIHRWGSGCSGQNVSDHPRFYAAKDEEVDTDSDEEEDEVLDFHKQKSEVIFWNDPRIR